MSTTQLLVQIARLDSINAVLLFKVGDNYVAYFNEALLIKSQIDAFTPTIPLLYTMGETADNEPTLTFSAYDFPILQSIMSAFKFLINP